MAGSIVDRWQQTDRATGQVRQTDRHGKGLRYRAIYRGPDGRQHSKSFVRKLDADRWIREQLGGIDQGLWVDPSAGGVTLAEWSARWLAGLHDVKPKTRAGYESLLRSRVLPVFGDHQLRRITPPAVRAWIGSMVAEGVSAARVRQARQVLHAMFEQAVDDRLVARNPTDRVKAPTVRPRRQVFLTAPEVARLAVAAEKRQEGARVLILLLAWSGIRWGEAVALTPKAVNVEKRRVRVSESVTEIGGRLVWGSPKTHEQRTVIVPRFVAQQLDSHMVGRDPKALMFCARQGGPLRVSNFRRDVWQSACEEAGMPEGLMVHDLRDTAASLMISAGASIKAVQRALGHASAKMTLDVYGGLFQDDLEDLADRLDARFGDSVVAPVLPEPSNLVHLPR